MHTVAGNPIITASASSAEIASPTVKHIFASTDLLKGLAATEVAELMSVCRERYFAPGEFILREGDHEPFVYILVDGLAQLTKKTSFGDDQIPIRELRSGDVLGESEDRRSTAELGLGFGCDTDHRGGDRSRRLCQISRVGCRARHSGCVRRPGRLAGLLGKTAPPERRAQALGEFAGISMLLETTLAAYGVRARRWLTENRADPHYEEVLLDLAGAGHPIAVKHCPGLPWTEVDNLVDLVRARERIWPRPAAPAFRRLTPRSAQPAVN